MISYLITLADHLDKKGFFKEAEYIDAIIKKAGEVIDLDEYRRKKEDEEIAEDILEGISERDLEDFYQDTYDSESEEEVYDDDSEKVMVVVLDDGQTYSMNGEVYFVSKRAARLLEDGEDVEDAINSDIHHKYLHLGDSRDELLKIINDEIDENFALDDLENDCSTCGCS